MTPVRFVRLAIEAIGILARIAWSRLGGPPTRGVMCLVLNDAGEVLLVKNSYRRRWSLPGGWVDPGESFEDAVVREVAEETGVILTDAPEFLAELVNGQHSDRLYRGIPTTTRVTVSTPWEISATQWCHVDQLPELANPASRILALGDWLAVR